MRSVVQFSYSIYVSRSLIIKIMTAALTSSNYTWKHLSFQPVMSSSFPAADSFALTDHLLKSFVDRSQLWPVHDFVKEAKFCSSTPVTSGLFPLSPSLPSFYFVPFILILSLCPFSACLFLSYPALPSPIDIQVPRCYTVTYGQDQKAKPCSPLDARRAMQLLHTGHISFH